MVGGVNRRGWRARQGAKGENPLPLRRPQSRFRSDESERGSDSCFDAFSRGEPASASLENALTAGRNCRGAPDHQGQWRRFSPGSRRTGKPLLLLHGWPEFWLTWEPVISRLSDRFMLIAPDLRGFGDSDKPDGPYRPDGHAADMLTLMDGLGIDRFAVVGHDVGGAVMQPLARQAPERLSGLFSSTSSIPASGRAWRRLIGSTTSGINPSTRWRWRPRSSAPAARAAGSISATSSKAGRIGRTPSTMFSTPSSTTSSKTAISPAALRIIAPRMPCGSR
ncbi:alpha/beta fold hydrolase [Bradyrhizobium japonicum]